MKPIFKAALAAGSIFAGTAIQAAAASPEFAGVEAASPVEQVLVAGDQPLVATAPAVAELELANPGINLNIPTLQEVSALAAIDSDGLVSDQFLGDQRGGAGIVVANSVIADQDLTQVTVGNFIVGDYVAGNVTVSDNAFSNFTGIGNLSINTGGLATMQSGINITINTGP